MREEQEAAVIAAVIAVVAEDPASLTVATVAERAGISRQTLYKQFSTLTLAVVAAHRWAVVELGARIQRHMTAGQPPANGLETLLGMADALYEVYAADPALLRFTSYYDFTYRVHQMTAAEREQHRLIPETEEGEGLDGVFLLGQSDGSVDPDLPVRVTSRAFSTSILGSVQRLQIQDDWTNGRDEAAREAYAALVRSWAATFATP